MKIGTVSNSSALADVEKLSNEIHKISPDIPKFKKQIILTTIMPQANEIEIHIANANIDQAIEALLTLCQNNQSDNYEDVLLLSSKYKIIQRQKRIGLGDFNREFSEIIKSLLSILKEEKKSAGKTNARPAEKTTPDLNARIIQLEEKVDLLLQITRHEHWEKVNDLADQYYWRNLEPESKVYLSAAEKGMLLEGTQDYSSVIIQYSKVLENELMNKVILPVWQTDGQEESLSYQDVLTKLISALSGTDAEMPIAKRFREAFYAISESKLINDLNALLKGAFRHRASHIGIMTRREAEDCRELTSRVLINLMNRPYSAVQRD